MRSSNFGQAAKVSMMGPERDPSRVQPEERRFMHPERAVIQESVSVALSSMLSPFG